MPQIFKATIGLRGSNGRVAAVNYDLGEFTEATPGAEYEAAVAALTQVQGALEAITAAETAYVRLTAPLEESNVLPVSEDARVYVVAAISCHIGVTGELPKYATVNVPAPIDALFVGDEGDGESEDIVDTANAALVQYIQQLSQHTFVSDGEVINTALGADGMRRGRRISRDIPNPLA